MVGGITNLFQKPIYKYYGVTHSRCDFLANNFGVSKNKIDFLPIGVDVDTVSTLSCKEKIRKKITKNFKKSVDKRESKCYTNQAVAREQ